MKKVWVPTPSLHTLLRVLGVDDEEKKRKTPSLVHDKRGKLSRLVASLHGAASASVYCVLPFFLPSSPLPFPPHTPRSNYNITKQFGLEWRSNSNV
jgi:hypothetical protein